MSGLKNETGASFSRRVVEWDDSNDLAVNRAITLPPPVKWLVGSFLERWLGSFSLLLLYQTDFAMMRMRLGATVPDFKARTTKGNFSFHDWIGNSWCMLFSHPADFTPVCTTELGRIAVHKGEFEKRNVKIIALSCDKLQDHTDWVNDIKSYCRDIPGDFPYPIISDESRELAVLLDMLDAEDIENPDTAMTVRAMYIIDPEKKLRLSMVYPTSTGRNVDEILRVIDSLQLTDRLGVIATPANWVVRRADEYTICIGHCVNRVCYQHLF